jgi:hypothetical protein
LKKDKSGERNNKKKKKGGKKMLGEIVREKKKDVERKFRKITF